MGLPIFLDLKFHDIPNTVANAVKAAVNLGVSMITVHTAGGGAMMEAAVEAAKHQATLLEKLPPIILGVTVLTSFDQSSLDEIGVNNKVEDQVKTLALLAKKSGLDGVICSPHEIELVRLECGADFKLVVPGIRSASDLKHDQKRVMSAAEAIKAGADFIVIGRPITKAENPRMAAMNLFHNLY